MGEAIYDKEEIMLIVNRYNSFTIFVLLLHVFVLQVIQFHSQLVVKLLRTLVHNL